MHDDTFQWLRETGFRAPTPSLATDEPLLSDMDSAEEPQPSIVGADHHDPADPEDYGEPGRRQENTELVAAVFRAADNPQYQDVRLRPTKTSHCPDLTYREFAMGRAKRVKGSSTW